MTSAVVRWVEVSKRLGAIAVAIAVVSGCDKRSPNGANEAVESAAEHSADGRSSDDESAARDAAATVVYEDGPTPGPDTLLAESGAVEVTLADFETSMQRSMLVAPEGSREVPKEQLAIPHLQINAVKNLLGSKIIVREAKRRGFEASRDEKVAALTSKPRLAPFAPALTGDDAAAEKLAERGLSTEDLEAVAEELALRKKLRDALIDNVDDEMLWEAYAREHDRVRLLVVSARNTPTMEEITRFVEEKPARITEHFEDHKKRYRKPRMVRMVRLLPKTPGEAEKATLEAAAERLSGEEAPEAIARDLGLRLDLDALLVRGENPTAFRSEVGTTGHQMSGARGAYAWKVTGFRASEEAELTSSLKREIAAELLRDTRAVPSRRIKVQEAIEALEAMPTTAGGEVSDEAVDDLRAKLEADGLEVVRTETFPKNERGYIPGVGLTEAFAERAFALKISDPVVDQPILSRGKVWAARLLEREQPSRERFERDKDSFRRQFIDKMKGRVIEDFIAHYQSEHDTRMDLKPLRIKYGTLQKN